MTFLRLLNDIGDYTVELLLQALKTAIFCYAKPKNKKSKNHIIFDIWKINVIETCLILMMNTSGNVMNMMIS